MKSALFSFLFLLPGSFLAQVEILGLSFWQSPSLDIYEIPNHLSKEKKPLRSVTPDSMGIFKALLDINEITTLQICDQNNCGIFYVQPKTRYLIELPQLEQENTYIEDQQEVELLFYKLDSTDINYQILGFEAWMDNYLADIYQLKDIRSNEFIIKIREFKAQAAAIYGQQDESFLTNYIKYSIGLTIDNFSVVGGPTKEDKFEFYLQTDSIDYKHPKLLEYAQLFYQAYDGQVSQALRQQIDRSFLTTNTKALIEALLGDPFVYNQAWAEFVAVQQILEHEQNGRISKLQTLEMLYFLKENAQQLQLKEATRALIEQNSSLTAGQILDKSLLVEDLGLSIQNNQLIYLHHYIPGNQKCIAEMIALKRLAERYKDKVQVISLYPTDIEWTLADQKAFEGANWPRAAVQISSPLWALLDWSSAPSYVLLDANLKVIYLNALGPLPNARTQTIDLILHQLIQQ